MNNKCGKCKRELPQEKNQKMCYGCFHNTPTGREYQRRYNFTNRVLCKKCTFPIGRWCCETSCLICKTPTPWSKTCNINKPIIFLV